MDEAIDGRERHGLVGEDFAPFAERLVGGYQHGSPLVTVELCNRAFEGQIATSDLELLYEIGRTREQHAPSVLDQGKPERCREMALATARWSEEQNVGAFLQPGIARRQRHDLGFRDHWHGLEVERSERLAGGQTR